MKRYLPLVIALGIFFVIKATNVGIRLSDTNIYFYTAYQLLQGQTLYNDIFFTNFPLVPYISSLYYLLVGKNLSLFYLTAAVEVICVAIVIFEIIRKKTNNSLLSLTGSLLYTYSFIILSTSDHQTGVFLASLFSILSYYFFDDKKYVISGIFIAATLLTKAYFIPLFLTLVCMLLISKNIKNIFQFFIAFCLTVTIILLPSLIINPSALWNDIIRYSLTGRTQGVSKVNILWFFITHDFVLFILLIFNLIMVKKHLFFGLFSLFSLLFFFFYKDTYYLYLNFLVPILCVSLPNLTSEINNRLRLSKTAIPILISAFIVLNCFVYFSGFQNLQKIDNIHEMVIVIQNEKPAFLYGQNDITPVLSYLTGTPLLNNIIDTNENIFRKGILSADSLSKDAIEKKAMLISHGVYYPEANIQEDMYSEIFMKDLVKDNCRLIKRFPVKTEGIDNRINFFAC
jgi:hypothetical protein